MKYSIMSPLFYFSRFITLLIMSFLLLHCSQKDKSDNKDVLKIIPGTGNWPSFRGEFTNGVADGQNFPDIWNGISGENVKWKTFIPGLAHSSPAISDKLLYIRGQHHLFAIGL